MTERKRKPSIANNTEPSNVKINCSNKTRVRTRKRTGSSEKIPISINRNFVNKADKATIAQYQNCFEQEWLTLSEIAEEINLGHAICTHYQGKRNADNFVCAQIVLLDFDNWSLEEALKDEFIQDHSCIVYKTPSHRLNGNGDRFRVGFKLEKPIEDARIYRLITKALIHKFPQADRSCSDPVRMFFGSIGGVL